jgi:hypothetical protein
METSVTRARRLPLSVVFLTLMAATAGAQIVEPDTRAARVRLGPIALNPVIDLTNIGVDTNVFNEPPELAKRDFTFTLTPRSDMWMKIGRGYLKGDIREDILWFQKYDSERSASTSGSIGAVVPLNHIGFMLNAAYARAHDRPGFEIDARAARTEVGFNGAVEVRALTRTFVGVQGSRRTIRFDEGQTFLASNLQAELDRTSTAAAVTVRHELTPLTSITFDAGRSEDRFDVSPLRDSTSTSYGVQLTFDPAALIKGTARFGYRDFEPTVDTVASYQGTTAAVNLSYALLGTTKFDVQAARDVQYSFDSNQPYYLQTGFGASIAQQVFGPIDVVGGLSRYQLAYRERTATAVALVDRVDHVRSYSGGVGYHLGPDVRIGFKVEKQQRTSDVFGRTYEGLRIGMAVTYGV